MSLMVYVDASFRGRRRLAAGIAAMLYADGKIIGRAALSVVVKDSHHAEGLAVVMGLQMASMWTPHTPGEPVIMHSDSSGLVAQINRNRASDEIRKAVAQLRDKGFRLQVLHARACDNVQMAHVDYLSKSITTES